MIKFVNAKINIGLNITKRRPDGYHDLSTIFYPVGKESGTPEHPDPFGDILEIVPGEERFVFTGRPIEAPLEKNLVHKAYSLFMSELERSSRQGKPGFDVRLDKQIPDGAGLGGGSADASFTLLALNELCGYPFDADELSGMALRLGADCPFFIINSPCYAEGVGERLTPVQVDLSSCRILIAKPQVCVSTAEAFSGITPKRPEIPLTELIGLPVEDWQGRIVNDFEAGIIARHPEVGKVKEMMLAAGAVYASMTGSGSALYALFHDDETRISAAAEIVDLLPGTSIFRV